MNQQSIYVKPTESSDVAVNALLERLAYFHKRLGIPEGATHEEIEAILDGKRDGVPSQEERRRVWFDALSAGYVCGNLNDRAKFADGVLAAFDARFHGGKK